MKSCAALLKDALRKRAQIRDKTGGSNISFVNADVLVPGFTDPVHLYLQPLVCTLSALPGVARVFRTNNTIAPPIDLLAEDPGRCAALRDIGRARVSADPPRSPFELAWRWMFTELSSPSAFDWHAQPSGSLTGPQARGARPTWRASPL